VDLTNEKMELQKQNIDESKKHNEAEIEKKKTEITSSEQQIEQLNKDINLIQKHIDMMQSRVSDELAMKNKSSKLINLESKLESRIKKIEKEVAFYEEHDSCPTCKQGIEQSFRTEQITNLGQTKGQVRTALSDLSTQIEKTNERIVEIQKILKNITSHNNEIVKHNSTKLKELREQLKTLEVKKEELTQEKQYYDLAASLLKDTGIKTKIIRQYLPIMNKLVNKYLTSMDFFVNFNINENFEETIKSRHRDEFSYANFSEGEKMRIDLALLFTWRQIAKLKNSTNTNLLILDEVFDSSLDGTGTEEFLKLIHEMGSDTNIFVISHKGDQLFDKFRSIIRFEKKNNFSQIAK
jgi:DNA repair exonuclease SbcCD ATPase subunit